MVEKSTRHGYINLIRKVPPAWLPTLQKVSFLRQAATEKYRKYSPTHVHTQTHMVSIGSKKKNLGEKIRVFIHLDVPFGSQNNRGG